MTKTMNMEILCKAKRKDNGKWVEGFYYKDATNDTIYLIVWCKEGKSLSIENFVEIVPESLSFFTQKYDKKNNKIFLGDIVTDGDDYYTVVFYDCAFCLLLQNDTVIIDLTDSEEYKVVGHITDDNIPKTIEPPKTI